MTAILCKRTKTLLAVALFLQILPVTGQVEFSQGTDAQTTVIPELCNGTDTGQRVNVEFSSSVVEHGMLMYFCTNFNLNSEVEVTCKSMFKLDSLDRLTNALTFFLYCYPKSQSIKNPVLNISKDTNIKNHVLK